MPSSYTMLAHEPSQVPENCALGGKGAPSFGVEGEVTRVR
jgi:hypothetical protein